jgi:DNA polymerase-3 subunit alpha
MKDKIATYIQAGYAGLYLETQEEVRAENEIKSAIETIPELTSLYKQDKFKRLMDLASKVEGTIRHSGMHACAIIIADKGLDNYTPIQKDSRSGKTLTQLDMYSMDCNIDDNAVGLLKFDFLGLRNLSIIQEALKLIKKYKIDSSAIVNSTRKF